jgi:hypothetical protein
MKFQAGSVIRRAIAGREARPATPGAVSPILEFVCYQKPPSNFAGEFGKLIHEKVTGIILATHLQNMFTFANQINVIRL